MDHGVYLFCGWFQLFDFDFDRGLATDSYIGLFRSGDGYDGPGGLHDAAGPNPCILVVYHFLENVLCTCLGASNYLYRAGYLDYADCRLLWRN